MKLFNKVLGLVSVAAALSSCMAPGQSGSGSSATSTTSNVSTTASSGSSGGSGGSGSQQKPPQAAIAAVSQQQMNLGVSLSVPVTIQSQNGYSGPVNLTIDNKVLAANDPMKTFQVSIAPASVNVTPTNPGQATVSIVSSSSSPDLSSFVNVVAGTPNGTVTGQVPLKVNAVYEIDILSSGNVSTTGVETWSLAAGSVTNFTAHPNGITINFVNKDPVEKSGFFRIHSTKTAFLHQATEGLGVPGSMTPNTNDAQAQNSNLIATTLGPTYSVTVLSQVAQLKNSVYDHNNENSGKASRALVFNAYTAPPKIGKSGNPNASFAFLQKNLFNSSMCVACHVTNPKSGNNVDLSTYTNVLNYVQAGSALGSTLYVNIIAGGSMPLGNPGSVPAAIAQDVQDWINDGAANN